MLWGYLSDNSEGPPKSPERGLEMQSIAVRCFQFYRRAVFNNIVNLAPFLSGRAGGGALRENLRYSICGNLRETKIH